MKSFIGSMIAAAALMAANGVWATEMPELPKKHDCDICHDMDKKLVGPAWKDVAKKYKGVTKYTYGGKEYDLEDGLVMAVSKGTSGNWGSMPMPANDPNGAKQTDMRGIVRFILYQAN